MGIETQILHYFIYIIPTHFIFLFYKIQVYIHSRDCLLLCVIDTAKFSFSFSMLDNMLLRVVCAFSPPHSILSYENFVKCKIALKVCC